MTVMSAALWVVGILLVGLGYQRARGPYARYQALREQDANEARYNAWRGGVRDSSPTGASVAMDVLRRQWQIGAAIAALGVVIFIAGFVVK